ncbi:MAG: rhodanese-like domain-containing protein [Bryobacteraceae bacterium]
MSLEITGSTTMGEILSAHPSAKLGLFRRYHIGGCTACGYQPTDTLEQVMGEHNISDPLEAVIAAILESRQVEVGLQILPTAVAAALTPKQEARLVELSSPEVEAALERGESWPLIDVRSPEEWAQGHIPGAQFLTLELKFEALDTWPKDTRIVFYSNSGRRSLEVASYFMAYGFTNVRNMAGGLEAWSGGMQASDVAPPTVGMSAIAERVPS